MEPVIRQGFAESDRPLVAELFWQAFKGKLRYILGPDARARAFISDVLDPTYAISAYRGGELLGVAGYKTADGALVGGKYKDLARSYGHFGALWRLGFLSVLERDVEPGELCMDGIFVSPTARGQGVGTLLLTAVCEKAKALGNSSVRLDVIDTNPRARALYARFGFEPVETTHMGPLRHVFGFRTAERMALDL